MSTATATPKPHIVVRLKIQNGHVVADPKSSDANLHDKVQFVADEGQHTVQFASESPFQDAAHKPLTTITDSNLHTVVVEGKFPFQCFIQTPTGSYSYAEAGQGGDLNVGHGGGGH